ncbi:hypothetical protein [Demequina mangrovi]|uniref:Uncharacterized protein n=1 Tax=Demequina mangrovi TaxID=1043493 RepID=A0A1H7A557_9MICO|nr:hypothetical protein [Demequina mangrovi]SEJ57000.1 hypothetical protein SAMN05421637_2233 [Demequina mangrovi]
MIFPAVWRILPGPAWLRVLFVLLIIAAVVGALFQWVYPWFSVTFDIEEASVEAVP